MSNNNIPQLPAPPSSAMKADDILYVLFRHKWKIVVCTVMGLLTAVALYLFHKPPYQSEATLFIRYITENSSPGLPGTDVRDVPLNQWGGGTSIMNTEVEILNSLDLAEQVADAVGPERILSKFKGSKERLRAAAVVQGGLKVTPIPQSSVIELVFKSPDPTLVQPVLSAIVDAYEKKHMEVHRGSGNVGDLLTQETDQLHSRLSQTEDDLRKAQEKAGIPASLDDAKKALAEQETRIEQEILSTNADLAERTAMLDSIVKRMPSAAQTVRLAAAAPSEPAIPPEELDRYQSVCASLDQLHKKEEQQLTQFTDQNQWVKDTRAQIAEAESQKRQLESKYPGLTRLGLAISTTSGSSAAATGAPGSPLDLVAESARLTGLQAKIKVLNAELQQTRDKAASLDEQEGSISELQRQKETDETDYRIISNHLEAAQIDDALTAGRALNIAPIQLPSPAHTDWKKTYKILGGISVGGFLLGLAWAFSIELYFDRSIRRPADVERGLRIPLFLSIPDFGRRSHDSHVFHETLRDRLVGYFESRNLTHKPKLLAVTGIGRNAGVTSTAAGLAKCLSETGDGNVLLVDMTISQGSSQQFYKGKPACGMDTLLDARNTAQVQQNLYVVGQEPNSEKLYRALPRRFDQLVPQLKASDFDYIIFDMPLIDQISITPRLAGFMDMVLLVMESEHTDQDIAREAVALLANSGAHVGAVLNKTRNYLPSKAHHDFLGTG